MTTGNRPHNWSANTDSAAVPPVCQKRMLWVFAKVPRRIRSINPVMATNVIPVLAEEGLDYDALLRRTRRQLLECARYLGLTGLHRLTKDALGARLLQAL